MEALCQRFKGKHTPAKPLIHDFDHVILVYIVSNQGAQCREIMLHGFWIAGVTVSLQCLLRRLDIDFL